MDNFETVKQVGNDNVVGKNIIYKSHIEINIYYNDKHQTATGSDSGSKILLYYLLVVFFLSLISTQLYFNDISQPDPYLICIVLLCGIFFIVAAILLVLKSHLINKREKDCLGKSMIITALAGIVVLIVYMNPKLFDLLNKAGTIPVFLLLGITFVNFLLGIIVIFQLSRNTQNLNKKA